MAWQREWASDKQLQYLRFVMRLVGINASPPSYLTKGEVSELITTLERADALISEAKRRLGIQAPPAHLTLVKR